VQAAAVALDVEEQTLLLVMVVVVLVVELIHTVFLKPVILQLP